MSTPTLEEDMKELGKHLALLLAAASMPDEAKEAWAALVPSMTLEQLEKFGTMLEGYIQPNVETPSADFHAALQGIKEKHTQEKDAIANDAMKQMDEIEKELNG